MLQLGPTTSIRYRLKYWEKQHNLTNFSLALERTTALLNDTNNILMTVDCGQFSILILLDLSASFDMVDYTILLNRLRNCVGRG